MFGTSGEGVGTVAGEEGVDGEGVGESKAGVLVRLRLMWRSSVLKRHQGLPQEGQAGLLGETGSTHAGTALIYSPHTHNTLTHIFAY